MYNWLENPPIDRVSPEKLEGFFIYLQEGYRTQHIGQFEIKPRPPSIKTRKNAWGTLSVFWGWATKELGIDNPFEVAPVRHLPKPSNPFPVRRRNSFSCYVEKQ